MKEKGYLSIVLHAHLPYVRHPEYDEFIEERWLFEAITETYIPLIEMFRRLRNEGVSFRLTMSITPTLANMLKDELLQDRYLKHIEKLIELAEKEIGRTQNSPFNRLARMYCDEFKRARHVFADEYNRNILNAFKEYQDAGFLEIITCGATHGFMPLMINPESVKAQVRVGIQTYQEVFGKKPSGIWLPECGYRPYDDKILKKEGIKYFLVDTHGILFAHPRPRYGVYSSYFCSSGVAVFGRDVESSKSVWSAAEGYPGDYYYREFYRDVGFDLDYEYVRPYINPDGSRGNTGIKYYRITGNAPHKEPYDVDRARDKAAEHAGNFMFNRQKQVEYLANFMDRKPIIVAPYDAELFGHWWFEGPMFLEFLIKKIYYDQSDIKLISPVDYLKKYPRNQILKPSFSSWGWKGYSEFWLNGANDWVYRHLHKAAQRMKKLALENRGATGLRKRALNQMARELLLAQSSDWTFIMKTATHIEYAQRRVKEHIFRFNRLYSEVVNNNIDEIYLDVLEKRDNLFANIDFEVYAMSAGEF
ncbi:MAG TPA: DUF1957 domain-containing protein [Candidatus Omnitrophica bacterium]|nr:DUF1957 domain-containing protein [Candidatus Omnitrophota bacterium]